MRRFIPLILVAFAACAPKSYVFWTPSVETAKTPKERSQIRKSQKEFDAWLKSTCGSFNRWEVEEGWVDPKTKKQAHEPGYFYWLQCNKVTAEQLSQKTTSMFNQKEAFVQTVR